MARMVQLDDGFDFDADLIPTSSIAHLCLLVAKSEQTRARVAVAMGAIDDLERKLTKVDAVLVELKAALKARL